MHKNDLQDKNELRKTVLPGSRSIGLINLLQPAIRRSD